jgi:hypothetical protein
MVADASTLQAQAPRLLSGLSRELVGDLRGYFVEHRSRVERATRVSGHGFDVARAYTKLYDGVLSALFGACHGAMAHRGQWHPLALGAVGSYGRRMLSPFSDLDVRLLCESDIAAAAPAAEALLYPLWDAGLSIGHQVVASDDLIELALDDVTTATALLDWRTITGDPAFGPRLLGRAYESVFDAEHMGAFIDRLEQRARARHQRFGDAVYLLEPDVKHGAGGLRDLDIAHWCARARYRVSDLSELCEHGVLLPREWAEVERARNQLLEIRHALHLCAGRRTDRLTFDLQERVTERLIPGGGFPATERLMSDSIERRASSPASPTPCSPRRGPRRSAGLEPRRSVAVCSSETAASPWRARSNWRQILRLLCGSIKRPSSASCPSASTRARSLAAPPRAPILRQRCARAPSPARPSCGSSVWCSGPACGTGRCYATCMTWACWSR